jgi:hypothetical protein
MKYKHGLFKLVTNFAQLRDALRAKSLNQRLIRLLNYAIILLLNLTSPKQDFFVYGSGNI